MRIVPPPSAARNRPPVLEIIKRFLVNIVCVFIPLKKHRDSIREYFLFPRIQLGSPRLPIKKRARPINLAFGFDGGFARQTGVALASLLTNSKDRCSYNIYCVVDDSVTRRQRDVLAEMVKTLDQDSTLTFLEANQYFDQARRGSWALAIYYRLMLPVLLPEIDEIIYADGDVIFVRDLLETADLDLGENLMAGVVEGADGYICSGFLVMNLARLRREKTYEVWREEARREYYEFPDQCLINATCRGRILYLPVKYNVCHLMYHSYRLGFVPPQDIHDLQYNAVMLHYIRRPKPWKYKNNKDAWNRLWWEYAKLTPFYESLLAELKFGLVLALSLSLSLSLLTV